MSDRNISYHIIESENPLILMADKDRLQQCIVNLVQNAIDAMPGGGMIEMSAQNNAEGRAIITIKDTGQGIPEDIRLRIFDLFYTTKKQGSGFGLGTVRKIIEAHSGDIVIEGNKPQGTTVTLILPNEQSQGEKAI